MNGFKKTTKRISAVFLAVLLGLSSVDYGVLSAAAAEETETTETTCPNHPEHTADCGYAEAVEGADCTHEHTDEAYRTVTECVHEHGAECYEKVLTCENTEEGHEHTDACYTETRICTHVCSVESGCIRQEPDCTHVHDESCGYVEAVEEQPCTHSCELCSGTTEEGAEEPDVYAAEGSETHLHSGDGKAFEPWPDNGGTGSISAGSYYLKDDVTLNAELAIYGGTVDICLNGHTLNLNGCAIFLDGNAVLNIYDCDAGGTTGKITGGRGHYDSNKSNYKGGAVYVKQSTLNLYGGSIEGNSATWGGAIFIDGTAGQSTVNMHGGTIQKNTAQSGGGGIEVEDSQSYLNMYGGSIVNNQVTEANGGYRKGGGVHFNQVGMTVSGKVIITGNTVADVENNVYLRNNRTITVGKLEPGSRIGVSAYEIEDNPSKQWNVITSRYGENNSASDIQYIFLDGTHKASDYALVLNGGELRIEKHSHSWKFRAGTGDDADKLYAYCVTDTSICGYHGEGCTALPLRITAGSPFTYSGSAYNGATLSVDELSAFNAATGKNLGDADIVYYTDADCTQKTTEADGAAGEGMAPVNVGTYYAAVTVDGAVAKAGFTIEKASVTVTPPTGRTVVCNNAAQELVTAGSVNDSSTSAVAGKLEYQIAADDNELPESGWKAEIPTAAEVGEYRVYYRAVTDDNHTPVDYKQGYPYVQAEITKTLPAYNAPQAAVSLIYDGTPKPLITAGETEQGTIEYSLNGTEWITDISKITGNDAGDYTVYWRIKGDDSHADVPQQTIKVTIQKAEPTAGAAVDCIIMSGSPLSSNTGFEGYTMKGVDGGELPGTFEWKDGAAVPSADGTQTAVFRPADTTNYKEVEVQVMVKLYYPPSGRITVKGDWWEGLLSAITFGIYHATEQEVQIEGTVNAKGGYAIDRIYYYIDTTGSTTVLSLSELEGRWQEYQDSNRPKVTTLSKNVIYAKITDVCGNAVVICSNGIIVDGQSPIAAVTVNNNKYTTSDNIVFKGSAVISITITDQGDAGLENVTAFYQKEGEAGTADIALTDGAGTVNVTTPGTYTLTLRAKDKAGNVMDAQVYKFTVVAAHTVTLTDATAKDAGTGLMGTGYLKDDRVTITADEPEEGYAFDYWETTGIDLDDVQKKSSVITITMPDNDITVKAVYRDIIAPVIDGIEDGGKYCAAVTVTVTDSNLLGVTLDGADVVLTAGRFTIPADGSTHIVKAADTAGNATEYTVTVYTGHDFANPVYTETGRSGNEITEEAPCGHGCGRKIVRKRTAEGDLISQEYPNDSGSNGSLATKVEVGADTPKISVKGLNIEVAKAFLSAAELHQVENGEDLLVYLKVNKLEETAVPAGDKEKTEERAETISNLLQGVYLDLSIWKKIGAAAEVQLLNAQTTGQLTITITLPEELRAPSGKVRTYYVIRVHAGVATVLPAVRNGNEISFVTDQFSTYSVWYTEDTAPASPSGGSDTPGTSGTAARPAGSDAAGSGSDGGTDAPKTADESNAALWSAMLLLSAAALTAVTVKRKKIKDTFFRE